MDELSLLEGGQATEFCLGFGAAAGTYWVGVAANWWNPVGQGAALAGGLVGAGCAAYGIYSYFS